MDIVDKKSLTVPISLFFKRQVILLHMREMDFTEEFDGTIYTIRCLKK